MYLSIEKQERPPWNTVATLTISAVDIDRYYRHYRAIPFYCGPGSISAHLRAMADFAEALEDMSRPPEDEPEECADEPAPPDACERCGSTYAQLHLDHLPIEIYNVHDPGIFDPKPRWVCDLCARGIDEKMAYLANYIVSRIGE